MTVFLISIAAVVIVLIALYLFLRFSWFYRDPVRRPAETERAIIAPADGQVVYIKRIDEGRVVSEKLGRPIELKELVKMPLDGGLKGWLVGIYMSPLDVHFNYAPVEGTVKRIVHTGTKGNLPMADLLEYVHLAYLRRTVDNFAKRFHFDNERNTLLLEAGGFQVVVVEIADKFVNKISCLVEEGQRLALGEKIGFIDRGSQVDLIILKEEVDFTVEFGDQVYGGTSVIARY